MHLSLPPVKADHHVLKHVYLQVPDMKTAERVVKEVLGS